jgi:site-specific recombinase XerD
MKAAKMKANIRPYNPLPDVSIIIERFRAHLSSLGHTAITVGTYLHSVRQFLEWQSRRKESLKSVDEGRIDEFIKWHLAERRWRRAMPHYALKVRTPLHRWLHFLRSEGMAQTEATKKRSRLDLLVSDFDEHLLTVRGLVETTRSVRLRHARDWLAWQLRRGGGRWSQPSPQQVVGYVVNQAPRMGSAAGRQLTISLRSFLRFLALRGQCRPELAQAVPSISMRRGAALPRILTEAQQGKMLRSFNQNNPTGQRDLAMALCQLGLGLRAAEVARLELNDFDWRQGTVLVRAIKGGRERVLPIPDKLGRAVATYLQNGRPVAKTSALFTRSRAPLNRPLTSWQVRHAMCRAYARCGFNPRWQGTHLLRHTFATQLHQRGAALKEIADLLGHRSLDTTVIYTHASLPHLKSVALPWPTC